MNALLQARQDAEHDRRVVLARLAKAKPYNDKTGGFKKGDGRWLPPKGDLWSGFCVEARGYEERNGVPSGSTEGHRHCRGAYFRSPNEIAEMVEKRIAKLKLEAKQAKERLLPDVVIPSKAVVETQVLAEEGFYRRCGCSCHTGDEEPRNMEREIADARAARAIASGRAAVTVNGVTGKRTKTHCRHNHEMTPENTGPGNVCRACKRDASNRTKAKQAEAKKLAEGGA